MDLPKSKLDQMLHEDDVPQTTEQIRKMKHSGDIGKDIDTYFRLRNKYKRLSKKQFAKIMSSKCNFIFNNYHNLFNKLISNQLDQDILHKFLDALKLIENGTLNQHEASYQIGLLLKKIFVDQAIKKEEQKRTRVKRKKKLPAEKITWDEYKKLNI